MERRRTGLLTALGILAAVAGAGIAAPEPARAAAVTDTVRCVTWPAHGGDFDWQPQIELSVAPQKAAYAIGDEVTVTWHWKTPPRNPSSWLVVAADTATPSGVVKTTGAQTGDIAMTGPRKNPTSWGGQPLAASDMTGKFKVTAAGRIDLSPGVYAFTTWQAVGPSTCTPTGTPAVATSIQSGTTPTPGGGGTPTPGGTGSPTPGGTASPGGTPAPGTPGATATPGATPSGAAPSTSVSPGGTGPGAGAGAGVPGGDAAPAAQQGPPPGSLFIQPRTSADTSAPADGTGPLTGSLAPFSVVDQRGSTLGWSLTGQVGTVTGPNGSALPGDRITLMPRCGATAKSPSAVQSGSVGPAALDPGLLCQQGASTGAVTGGEFQVDVGLVLDAPRQGVEPYAVTVTLSLT
ncbi:hypothetical protein [Yinghuangia seranimata]|uniref:hypothetical protein n=1 Tax=Yinghuangia seranimata TaxID=408067 RepID=UPI00248AE0E1|nr:hypothetical protein [Yinghuangia seranimata]MDI2128963.1 hypothetical protein [Yinghuangia seranimata]